jgi:ribosomal protein S20
MKNTILSAILAGASALLITGCSTKTETIEPQQVIETDFRCMQENALAPKWTCVPMVEGFYAGVGVAKKSAAGMGMMRKIAQANGRSDLAQQIQSQVKDKVETFTRITGNGDNETVDQVSTAVSKQIAKVDLLGSKGVDVWTAPSGDLYMLVTVPQSSINNEVKTAIKTSFKNDDALWQQFQSKNALEGLEKEFPSE